MARKDRTDNFHYIPSAGEFWYKDILWNRYTSQEIIKKVEAFEFRDNDILLCTFPRSGTTLTQEIIWHIKNKDCIKLNQTYGDIDSRFPFLEYDQKFFDENLPDLVDILSGQGRNETRLIKTHCPLSLIYPNLVKSKPKILLVMRNPKDVCVSLYHFYRGFAQFGPWNGEWDEFFEMFVRGYTKCGNWFAWQLEWWEEIGYNWSLSTSRQGWPVFAFTFEQLIADSKSMIKQIAQFLEEPLTPEQLDIVLKNCHFDAMSQNTELNVKDPTTNFSFIRKGKVGGWRELFTQDQSDRFDAIFKQELGGTGLTFQYE